MISRFGNSGLLLFKGKSMKAFAGFLMLLAVVGGIFSFPGAAEAGFDMDGEGNVEEKK